MTGLATVTSSLVLERFRFVSFTPHSLPRRERFAEVSARAPSNSKALFLYSSTAFPASASRWANRDTGTGKPGLLAELFKYTNRKIRSSTAF